MTHHPNHVTRVAHNIQQYKIMFIMQPRARKLVLLAKKQQCLNLGQHESSVATNLGIRVIVYSNPIRDLVAIYANHTSYSIIAIRTKMHPPPEF